VFAAPAAADDLTLTMSDGVQVTCTYTGVAGAAPHSAPAVMLFHGLGGTHAMMAPFAQLLGPAGYATLACDARGHGASGGLFGLDGPRDVQDTRELFDWLAARPEVNGAAIGAFGISLGGGAVWNAAAAGVPFKAIVPTITWTNLQESLAPQGLAKSGLVLYLSQLVPEARYDPAVRAALPSLLTGGNFDLVAALATSRSVDGALPRLTVPTLLIQGRHDFLFDIDQALAAYRQLAGPHRLYVGDLGHSPASNPAAEVPYYAGQAQLWFDRFLKGMPNGIDRQPPVQLAADPWTGKVASFATPPPTKRLAFKFPARSVVRQGGKAVRSVRLREPLETFGDSVVSFRALSTNGWDHVVAVLSSGSTVISEGGTTTSFTGSHKTYRIRLLNEAVHVRKGANLTLTLAAVSTAQSPANLLYARDVTPGMTLAVDRIALSLSVLKQPVSR
jgi:pimeloyl-ACP methyl ester carboxylesterase